MNTCVMIVWLWMKLVGLIKRKIENVYANVFGFYRPANRYDFSYLNMENGRKI